MSRQYVQRIEEAVLQVVDAYREGEDLGRLPRRAPLDAVATAYGKYLRIYSDTLPRVHYHGSGFFALLVQQNHRADNIWGITYQLQFSEGSPPPECLTHLFKMLFEIGFESQDTLLFPSWDVAGVAVTAVEDRVFVTLMLAEGHEEITG